MPWRGWGRCGGESEWVWVLIGSACSHRPSVVLSCSAFRSPPSIHRCDPRMGHLVGCDWVLGWVREPPLWCDWVGFSSGATPGLEAGLEWHRTASPTVVYRWTQAIRHAHHVRACVKAILPPAAPHCCDFGDLPIRQIHTGGGCRCGCPWGKAVLWGAGRVDGGTLHDWRSEGLGPLPPPTRGVGGEGEECGHAVGHTRCVTYLR